MVVEIKLDGYCVLALKDGPPVRLLSRRNKDLTRDFLAKTAQFSLLGAAFRGTPTTARNRAVELHLRSRKSLS